MAEKFDKLDQKHIEFINNQHIFFVATAGCEGFVNLSPKGMDTLKIINPNKIIWLNYTGSGNESAAHVQENARMTIMWCSFDKKPLILKVYGKAKEIRENNNKWVEVNKYFKMTNGVRQYFELDISLVLTSCGYGVPYFEYKGERDTLIKWIENKGNIGIKEYQKQNNTISLNGKRIDI